MKTAECVSPKHPDKLCDQISDAILDECLKQDPFSRVAIETFGCHGVINVGGELTTKAFVDVREIVGRIVPNYGVQVNIVKQSPEIAGGVDTGGAGDQGIMVGYACNDNEAMIPQEHYLARSLCQFIYYLHPFDGKTQITLDDNGAITTIVASFQNVSQRELEVHVNEWLMKEKPSYHTDVVIHANPAGDWAIGGFDADTGLTGRKLMVDNYGPQVAIGGGCFSGKDGTKVDRSGAYIARKMAVHFLKHMKAKEVVVKLAYAIGVAQPVMVSLVVDGKPFQILDGWDLTPGGIITKLNLREPQFEETAKWGHFGNNFTWDK